jgi:type IV secretion system protein VirB6
MACPTVLTGSNFLVSTLSHLDCQAQTLGSFGFQSLAQTGSPASLALTGLLTLFIALYGIRLLFSAVDEPRDLIGAVLKVGIVLTMAMSWPAWRILAYDTVLIGPAEIAASILPSTLPAPTAQLPQRLQAIDVGIAVLTAAGTGRQSGQLVDRGPAGGFRTIALEDESGFAWSRTVYLASTIGSLAMVRVAGGLLLALAPLMAAALLFDTTRGIFSGWIRGLVLVALGSLGITIVLSVQVALMEPWVADAVNRRNLGYATPSAPTELLALVIAFAIASAGLLFLLTKVAFQNAWTTNQPTITRLIKPMKEAPSAAHSGTLVEYPVQARAAAMSGSMATSMRREDLQIDAAHMARRIGIPTIDGSHIHPNASNISATASPLGSGYRRSKRSDMRSQKQRDDRQ